MALTPFEYETARIDWLIQKGSTWLQRIIWQRPAGTALDLTGFTAHAQVRKDGVGDILLDLLSTGPTPAITIDGPTGTITLGLTAVQTTALTFKNGMYDLLLIQVSPAWTVRLCQGTVRVDPGVTL